MRDAIGEAFVLQVVVIFFVLINSYLAFSVNYTKAFRVKNKIISIIENYEGLTCGEDGSRKAIENMMFEAGYSINSSFVNSCGKSAGLTRYKPITATVGNNKSGGYCYYITPTSVSGRNHDNELYKGSVYSVVVFVNIDLPVINRLIPYMSNIFAVKGETKTIYSSGFSTELGEC